VRACVRARARTRSYHHYVENSCIIRRSLLILRSFGRAFALSRASVFALADHRCHRSVIRLEAVASRRLSPLFVGRPPTSADARGDSNDDSDERITE